MKDLKLKPASRAEGALPGNYEHILQSLAEGANRLPAPAEAVRRVKQLNRDREMLRRLKKQAEYSVSECRAVADKASESGCRKIVSQCDILIRRIDSLLRAAKESERAARREKAKRAYQSYRSILGDFAQMVFDSPAFYEEAWELPGGPDPKSAVKEKCRRVSRQLEVICRAGGPHAAALIDRYLQTFSDADLSAYRARLEQIAAKHTPDILEDEDKVTGYKVIRAEGTRDQFARLYALMGMAGMRCTEEEDGMPGDMQELLLPDFDSFVCFDLESSGSLGNGRGDGPAEIIEIGAVRVQDGMITDRFSTLVNPGRKIVPRVAKLTGITDDMVRGKPTVGQAVRAFAAFAGDSILVGHNIRSCDIPMIVSAGKKEGIAFENAYFDTYLFAEANREGRDWQGLGLEALAHSYGIEMSDAHRAWCDAEANAQLYLAMRNLPGIIRPALCPRRSEKKAETPAENTKKKSRPRRRRRRSSAKAQEGSLDKNVENV